ncbi:conserved Plasmodium protein, unknown function [Plasmodium ovale wallikeri]|uniref:Uncharacterized protein n=1 Tax=Plasmodium ovale wallikeri TaxID=864142 RepID=A0A1A8ZX83_PLAOA|nr:conserved Plasmodium protein, unknown function [Plasmodium ovale wallikeri]
MSTKSCYAHNDSYKCVYMEVCTCTCTCTRTFQFLPPPPVFSDGNNMNACNDDYEYDQCDYNSGNVKNTHNKNAEDADYYL